MAETGVRHSRLRVTRKVIDFGRPYGAYDVDGWILKHHALSFYRLADPAAGDMTNSGITAGYVGGPGDGVVIGTPAYDPSICGFPDQDCLVCAGAEAVYATQPHPELAGVVTGQCVGAVVSLSLDDTGSLLADEAMLLVGVKATDTGDYLIALAVRSDGTTVALFDGVSAFDGPQIPADTPTFATLSISASGYARILVGSQEETMTTTAPSAMAATSRMDIGACVESAAVVTKAQDIDLLPFIGAIERVFFTRAPMTPRAVLIAQHMVTLQTYYDPKRDFDAAPAV